jgi:hypothetical protein
MSNQTVKEKLRRASKNKEDQLTFEIKNGEDTLYNSQFDLPKYANDVLKKNEESFYYYFKDVKDNFLKKLAEEHQKMIFKEQNDKKGVRPALDDFSAE